MQTVTVNTTKALFRAIKAGIGTIVIGNPRLSLKILKVLRFKPAALAMSTIVPPVLFPPLAPLFLFLAVSVLTLGVILYLAFIEGYEVVVEKDTDGASPRIIIRKRQPEASKSQPTTESHTQPAANAQPAPETATSPQ